MNEVIVSNSLVFAACTPMHFRFPANET